MPSWYLCKMKPSWGLISSTMMKPRRSGSRPQRRLAIIFWSQFSFATVVALKPRWDTLWHRRAIDKREPAWITSPSTHSPVPEESTSEKGRQGDHFTLSSSNLHNSVCYNPATTDSSTGERWSGDFRRCLPWFLHQELFPRIGLVPFIIPC